MQKSSKPQPVAACGDLNNKHFLLLTNNQKKSHGHHGHHGHYACYALRMLALKKPPYWQSLHIYLTIKDLYHYGQPINTLKP